MCGKIPHLGVRGSNLHISFERTKSVHSKLDFVQKALAFRSKKFRLWRFTPKLAQWAKCSLLSPQHLVIALGRTTTFSYFVI